MNARRRSSALIATGLAFLLVAGAGFLAPSAGAQEEPGSGFGTFSLSAGAHAVKVVGPDPVITGTVPEASVQLRNGPIGYGLASIAWPGPIAANAGSLLLLLGNPACTPPNPPPPLPPPPEIPNCPGIPQAVLDNANALNYPVRAEARTGTEQPTVTNNSAGAQMTATALNDEVSADAIIGAAEASVVGVGNTRSSSRVKLTGASTGESIASSRVEDISLAGGAITIGAVVSTARATTDGLNAIASGATRVIDVRIAGQPVAIDREGLRVLDHSESLAEATDAVNEALANLDMKIAFSEPTTVRRGGAVSYSPGSLVFTWAPPDEPAALITVVLGNTTVVASAVPPFTFGGGTGGGPIPGGGALPPVAGGSTGFGGNGGVPAPAAAAPPTVGTAPAVERVALAGQVGAGWIALAVVGAILLGTGARRGAVLVLSEAAGAAGVCPEEASP